MKYWRSSLSVAALAVACFVGCKPADGGGGGSGGGGATGGTIKIGEFASLTGKEATFGNSSHEGTLLAVEEVNAAGGVLGRKFDLLTEDDQSKPGESATVVNKLISRDGVVAILGEVASSRSLEAAPICQQSKIPMISPSSTNPKVTETGDFVFRVCFTDILQGKILATFAGDKLKAKKVAIFTDVKAITAKDWQNTSRKTLSPAAGRLWPSWISTAVTRILRRNLRRSSRRVLMRCLFRLITPKWP
jgi:branched-chain amino acid transport system substrate-binding protein